ncbi:hypothetical protein CONPUDRAFT_87410 [Coniophora puteana RWD-64-598 SS2]|uniref:DUF1776-domain-containing protein n=1 Tax=Coniophora puteana (strain RWD-64-598) TaxID=741705 RepID=A0A5M3N0X4_CONPW|nr:uncharacterized protein CONPUDRAFT_87410 [Coniophora puteana RWD-64-598 SS2]EIW84907.1 hypothetical protein CONPUDRAFT_87410 [Coniophora puteana RWD-64-598 SS2]
MVPSAEEVEEYFRSLERYVEDTVSSAAPNMPNAREAFSRLWTDISRFGPPGWASLPDIPVPGPFKVPPPPPPPPPPKSTLESAAGWVSDHKVLCVGALVGAIGVGTLAGYGPFAWTLKGRRRARATGADRDKEKRRVVVVLGADHPLGFPLVAELERAGYVVIASVSTPAAVDALEGACGGFLRALVLDPNEPATIPVFLRSLASTLSRRFPLTSAGDPYAPSPHHPVLYSVVSLLTLPSSIITPNIEASPHAPLEALSLQSAYIPRLLASHVAPVQVLQALLPLLRADAVRFPSVGSCPLVMCVPAPAGRIGLAFGGADALIAAANVRAADLLRREAAAADGMGRVKVITIDVGAVAPPPGASDSSAETEEAISTDDWTPSELAAYGRAFTAFGGSQASVRRPSDVRVFVDGVLSAVSGGARTHRARSMPLVFGLPLGLWSERWLYWLRGDRFALGAGAGTYSAASVLPLSILDTLLNIPHALAKFRNRLTAAAPSVTLPGEAYPAPGAPSASASRTSSYQAAPVAAPSPVRPTNASLLGSVLRSAHDDASEPLSDRDAGEDVHETGSEADVESNDGDGVSMSSGVGTVESSWVSLDSRGAHPFVGGERNSWAQL